MKSKIEIVLVWVIIILIFVGALLAIIAKTKETNNTSDSNNAKISASAILPLTENTTTPEIISGSAILPLDKSK